MPVIKIEALQPTKEQSEQLIKELTSAASRILNVPEQFFYVIVKENSTDNYGFGGETLTKFFAKQQEKK